MIRLSVQLQIQSAQSQLGDMRKQVTAGASRAINRAIDSARSTAAKSISAATHIQQKQVRTRLYVTGSTPDHLVAELDAHPYSPNLASFNATEQKEGVAATAWEARKVYRHSFINPRTGLVVARTGPSRFPLKGLRGPSVPRTFERDDIIKQIDGAARETFEAQFAHEVERRTGSTVVV